MYATTLYARTSAHEKPYLVLLHSHDGLIQPRKGGVRNLFAWGRSDRCLGDWRGYFSESGTEFLRNATPLLLACWDIKNQRKTEQPERESGEEQEKQDFSLWILV